MFCVIYGILFESQRDLRMTSYRIILKFCHCIKNNTKIQGEGLCTVKEILKLPGSLLLTGHSKAVILV